MRPDQHDISPRHPASRDRALTALLHSLDLLWHAGEREWACRLAGHTCVLLQAQWPAQAARFDRALHRWTRAETRHTRENHARMAGD